MPFAPQTYKDPSAALTDLELRIKAAFDEAKAATVTRTLRLVLPAIAASSTMDVTATWATPFADASYTVVATLEELQPTTNGNALRQIRSHDANGCVVRVAVGAAAQAAGSLALNLVAIHD